MSRVLRRYFDDMSDTEFAEIFRQDFARQDAVSHEEYLCERALMLLKPVFCGHAAKIGGMDMLADLLDSEDTRMVLREKYWITISSLSPMP